MRIVTRIICGFLLLYSLAAICHPALAGNVITTNLPLNTAIVNVIAKQDGAAGWNANQDSWFQPFFTGGATALTQLVVQPGTYSFRLTNPTLAAAEFPSLSSGQLSQIFTAWTYNSPWITDYFVFDAAGVANSSVPDIFAGAIRPAGLNGGTGSAIEAFNLAVNNHFDDIIVKQPGGRITGVRTDRYTFTSTETLTFAVPDNILSDNNGGVSIIVSPATPAGLFGDYNSNGVVDAADYVLWRKSQGTTNTLPNDPTGGTIGAAQYATWRSNFGRSPGSGAANSLPTGSAVPEPATLTLLTCLAALAFGLRR